MDFDANGNNPFLSPLNSASARLGTAQKRTASFAKLEDGGLHDLGTGIHGAKGHPQVPYTNIAFDIYTRTFLSSPYQVIGIYFANGEIIP